MTQNDKDLLLKDLCARLPYGVKIDNMGVSSMLVSINNKYRIIVETVEVDKDPILDVLEIEDCKPYLLPMSSMTEEQIYEINEILGGDFEIDKYGITDLIRNKQTSLSYLELDALFEYFNKNNFDYRGLIPMGLAIDATGLNIY